MEAGTFIISLDYELNWGVYDSMNLNSYSIELQGVHEVLPQIIKLFNDFEVRSTVATVGLLFCKSKDEIKDYLSQVPGLSPQLAAHIETIGADADEDPYHYDRGALGNLIADQRHEVASHSLSHLYCTEAFGSLPTFEADTRLFNSLANTHGVNPSSYVFPRNQISAEHLEVLKKYGFSSFRGNPDTTFHKRPNDDQLRKRDRIIRLLDAYAEVTPNLLSKMSSHKSGLIDIPASLFLRAVKNEKSKLAELQLGRIKKLMRRAANEGGCFHLWWHPHNFGRNQDSNLNFLNLILEHYATLRNEKGMRSLTMHEASLLEHVKS